MGIGMEMGIAAEGQAQELDDLLALSIEAWKFVRLFQRALSKFEPSEQTRFSGQIRFFQRRVDTLLEARGIRLESLEGHLFEPGLAATPLNADEFSNSEQRLVVAQMIEPVVMGPNGVVRTGTFLLGAL